MPKTNLGKWAVKLLVIFLLLLGITQLVLSFGHFILQSQPFFLAALIVPAGVAGILAFFTGVYSIVEKKERSWLVFVCTLVGFFILYFVISEFVFLRSTIGDPYFQINVFSPL